LPASKNTLIRASPTFSRKREKGQVEPLPPYYSRKREKGHELKNTLIRASPTFSRKREKGQLNDRL
jgi:hypothetical protein